MDGHKVDALIEGLQAILAWSQEQRDSLAGYDFNSGNQSFEEEGNLHSQNDEVYSEDLSEEKNIEMNAQEVFGSEIADLEVSDEAEDRDSDF